MKFIHLIDNIAINFLFFENLIIMKDLKRSYNLIIDLSKFTSNKKILDKNVAKLCLSKTIHYSW